MSGEGRLEPLARKSSAAGYSLEPAVEASGSDGKLWPQIAKQKTETAFSRCRVSCFRGLGSCLGSAFVLTGNSVGEPMGAGFFETPPNADRAVVCRQRGRRIVVLQSVTPGSESAIDQARRSKVVH